MLLRVMGSYQPPARFEPANAVAQIQALRINPWRRLVLRILYRRAVASFNTREKITYLYNLGYGLLRPRFQLLARLLMKRGLISDEEDIFYYGFDEIETMVDSENVPEEYRDLPMRRKSEMEALREVDLPLVNNGWFLSPRFLAWRVPSFEQRQCLPIWVFRAVETRTPFLSCANAGITCAVAPDGRILGRIDRVMEEDYLHERVPPRWPEPIFLRGGFLLPPVLLLLLLPICLCRARRKG